MAKELQLASVRNPKGKQRKFVILFKGNVVSRHRTLSNARSKFNKFLRIAKK